MNAVGAFVALSAYLAVRAWQRLPQDSRKWWDYDSQAQALKLFLAIGLLPVLTIRLAYLGYLHVQPYGFLGWIGGFWTAGYVLLTTLAFSRGGDWWIGLGFMAAFEVGFGLLSFSKLALLQSLLPMVFGYLNAKHRAFRNFWPLCFLALAYLGTSFYTQFARQQQLGRLPHTRSGFRCQRICGKRGKVGQ